jgi:hypothetical protein
MLVRLQSDGTIQWQNAYSGGVYCFFNGFSETCTNVGAVIYSAHQTSDGGYDLVGSGDLELNDSVPLVPWGAKADALGNLIQQHFYYQTNPATGRTLSEYFGSSSITSGGRLLGLGWTENLSNGLGQLYGVRVDSSGIAGPCNEVRNATPLQVLSPGLSGIPPTLPVQMTSSQSGNSPARALGTSITTKHDC